MFSPHNPWNACSRSCYFTLTAVNLLRVVYIISFCFKVCPYYSDWNLCILDSQIFCNLNDIAVRLLIQGLYMHSASFVFFFLFLLFDLFFLLLCLYVSNIRFSKYHNKQFHCHTAWRMIKHSEVKIILRHFICFPLILYFIVPFYCIISFKILFLLHVS